jgi:tetratricopeptide (TPR) repeat protein
MFTLSIGKKAADTTPNVPYYGLAFSHVYQGNLAEALKTLQDFLDIYTRNGGRSELPAVFIWNSLGRLLLENGRLEESRKMYEKGYETVPPSSLPEVEKMIWLGRLHHGRGRVLAKMGQQEAAWKEAELVKKMIDEGGERGQEFLPSFHYIAGYVKLEAGDLQAAIEHLEKAETDPFRKLLLARAYDKSGNEAGAQKLYREIVNSTQNTMERALAYGEAKRKMKN